MKNITVFVLFIISNFTFAQHTLKGVLINKDTEKPVSFANIYSLNTEKGTYSNEKGEFEIESDDNDTLIFSSIGYEKYYFDIPNNTKRTYKIYLAPTSYEIEQISINVNKKTKRKELQLGYHNLKKTTTLMAHSGAEYVLYIPNNLQKEALLDEVILNMNAKRKGIPIFRIHVYTVNENNFPGEELLNQDLIGEIVTKKKIRKYSIKNQNVIIPKNGLFVGVEWIGFITKKGVFDTKVNLIELSIPITFESEKPYTFFRSSIYSEEWHQAKKDHPLCELLEKNNPPNVAIGIKVIFYD